MKTPRSFPLLACDVLLLLPLRSFCIDSAVSEVERQLSLLKSGNTSALAASIQDANNAIEAGKKTSAELKDRLARLEKENALLENKLIGAGAAFILAVLGWMSQGWSSRGERHLKQLEIIEKIAELEKLNVPIPAKIADRYKNLRT